MKRLICFAFALALIYTFLSINIFATSEIASGHIYKNGICTACGADHSILANYSGKVISILGDSISTFAGYIPTADGFNLEHLARYPDVSRIPDVLDVNETWWMQTINALNAKLGINDSWRGAMVSGASAVTTGATGPDASMANLVRIQNLGANGKPDVILFYGGTNDYAHLAAIGIFNPLTAPTEPDFITASWNNLADAYMHTILRLKHYYPNAQIVAMFPTYTASYYSDSKLEQGNAVLAQICDHYRVPYIDLRNSGVTAEHLPDGIHPDAEGMDLITSAVLECLASDCEITAGENVVYKVEHHLSGAKASLSFYKGITAGNAFVETLTGEDLSVTVTMGGVDITSECYANGVITIDNVTADLAITASAVFNADGHLQQLPKDICSCMNIWNLLEHDREYYTISGWGVHNSGTVYSVTIPVAGDERIYATSMKARGENGNTAVDGIRVTFFLADGTVKSLGAPEVYAEFAANGCLNAPDNAIAVSVPMWTNDDSNELYILGRDHTHENGSGICGDNLTWTLTDDGVLTISGSGDMYDYAWYLPAPWSDYIDSIKAVIIEEGITSIGSNAFDNCAGLEAVSIPKSLSKISEYAFANCSSVKNIELPDGLKSIGQFAFSCCTGLIDVALPSSLETVGDSAFFGCDGLERIVFLNASTSIYDNNSTIPDSALICGYENSTAEAYAETVGRKFAPFCKGNHTYSNWQNYTETQHIRRCLGVMLDSRICGTATGYLSISDRIVSWPDVSVGAQYVIIYDGDIDNKLVTAETSVTAPDYITKVEVFYDDMPLGDVKFSSFGEFGADCNAYELANHSWDNGIITTAPTCSADSIITYTCTDCDAEQFSVAPSTGIHSFDEWEYLNDECHIRFCSGIAETFVATGELCSEVAFSIPIVNDISFGDKLVLRLPTIGKYYISVNDILYPLGTTNTTIYGEYTITFGDRAYGYNSKNGDTLIPLSAIDDTSAITIIGRYPIKTTGTGKVTYRVTSADFGYYNEPSENAYANSKFTTTFWPTTQHYDVYAVLNGNTDTKVYCWDWNATDREDVSDNTDLVSYCRAFGTEAHDWDKDNGVITDNMITYTCRDCNAKLTEEYLTYTTGDLNGDEIVDKNDAIYLLYSVLFGSETYPLNQPCDYNADEITDKNDAIYLLYHALFGAESYPLN